MRANLDLFHRARDTDNAGDVVLIATAHEADRWPRHPRRPARARTQPAQTRGRCRLQSRPDRHLGTRQSPRRTRPRRALPSDHSPAARRPGRRNRMPRRDRRRPGRAVDHHPGALRPRAAWSRQDPGRWPRVRPHRRRSRQGLGLHRRDRRGPRNGPVGQCPTAALPCRHMADPDTLAQVQDSAGNLGDAEFLEPLRWPPRCGRPARSRLVHRRRLPTHAR